MSARYGRGVAGGIVAKLAAWLVALGLVAAPIIGVLTGTIAGDHWPFRQLRIDAAFRHVNAEQVQMAVAPTLTGGFFAVDLGAVQAAVERLPWVAHAEIAKRWPDQLVVRIVEHAPIARFGDGRLVANDGQLFEVQGDVPEGLPLIDCPESRLRDTLNLDRNLARDLAAAGLVRDELHWSPRGAVTVHLTNGAQLALGRDALSQRLARFLTVWPHLSAPTPGGELLSADLRYSNGFALAWTMPAPAKAQETPVAPRAAPSVPAAVPPGAPAAPSPSAPAAPAAPPDEPTESATPPNDERRA